LHICCVAFSSVRKVFFQRPTETSTARLKYSTEMLPVTLKCSVASDK
jgi:hypothetical protein